MTSELDVGQHPAARGRGVTAVLGPTNTGKTHLAIERMLGHESGIIGLPLRLLAREVYDRVAARVGKDRVALVTGEEKIKPEDARYWIATVEAMPRDLDVAFVAVDEVQLAADLERGHVFTDRLLRQRGREETLLLGAGTMRGILSRLMPGLNVITRPRLSHLAYAGQKKLTRLPERSAIVAFSANEVYAIAELMRRQRGGAAVVLGALSPRTRNAQVEMYQSGDVDFLIATDAIGMGLNLDVDHVAFASRRKFDGWQFRDLNPVEMGQISGRAGRHLKDGTFGVTGRVDPLEPELVERLESHDFAPVELLQWRNPRLDFSSLAALQESLAATPTEVGLTRALATDDAQALDAVAQDEEIRELAADPRAVELLWDVCQVPDYRKIAPANHFELVATLYRHLVRDGEISHDWFAGQVAHADNVQGDIDTLSNRIAHIRTWTFVANRPDWLADPAHWQEKTRAVEDRLSDALHERLTQRFVDRRTSVLARRLRENAILDSEIATDGDVSVEGQHVGRLTGLAFVPDTSGDDQHRKAISAAARKTLTGELAARAEALAAAKDDEIAVSIDGTLDWKGAPVGRLESGESVLTPKTVLIGDELLAGAPRQKAETRLSEWLTKRIETLLGPLLALERDENLNGMTRGLAFQIREALGILDRARVSEDVRALPQEERASLRRHGVRFGAHHLFVPALMKPGPRVLAAQLWALHHGGINQPGFVELAELVRSGRMSIGAVEGADPALYTAFGYRLYGKRAIRVDILERLADLIRNALSWRENSGIPAPPGAVDGRVFTVSEGMTSLAGCAGEDFEGILVGLGYRSERRPNPALAPAGTVARSGEGAVSSEGSDASAEPSEERAVPVDGAKQVAAEADSSPEATGTLEEAESNGFAEAPGVADGVEVPRQVAASDEEAVAEDIAAAAVEASPDIGTATPAAELPEEIVVWRPVSRRDQQQRRDRRKAKGDGAGKSARSAGGDGAGKERPPRQKGKARPGKQDGKAQPRRQPDKRPEKQPDPNSPFAALAALRDELSERDR